MVRMNRLPLIRALAILAVVMATGAVHAAGAGTQLRQRPVSQTGGATRALEASSQQASLQILCRGGMGLSLENRGAITTGSGPRDMVAMALTFRRGDRPAGPEGRALEQGTCAAVDRALGPMEPSRIEFEIAANDQSRQALHGGAIDTSPSAAERHPDAKTMPGYLSDASHYWRFDVVRAGGTFKASSGQPLTGPALSPQRQNTEREVDAMRPRGSGVPPAAPIQQANGGALPSNLFQMDDRAIIIIGGKQVAAGEVKRDILARLPQSAPGRPFAPPVRRNGPQVPAATVVESAAISSPVLVERASGGVADRSAERAATIDCSRSPLPGRMQGRLTPGEPLKIAGACFGDAPGSLELIGQFRPSGSLTLKPLSWRDGEIVVATPRDVRDVPDHVVALTIVRADGKRSSARQTMFVASRERIEVSSLWAPSARYTWRGVYVDGYDPFKDPTSSYQSGSGQAPPSTFRLHINPACSLDSMEANPRLGAVTGIGGWETGMPNEANVNVFWTARKTTTNTKTPWSYETVIVYEMDFDLRAWASCPAGIRP